MRRDTVVAPCFSRAGLIGAISAQGGTCRPYVAGLRCKLSAATVERLRSACHTDLTTAQAIIDRHQIMHGIPVEDVLAAREAMARDNASALLAARGGLLSA